MEAQREPDLEVRPDCRAASAIDVASVRCGRWLLTQTCFPFFRAAIVIGANSRLTVARPTGHRVRVKSNATPRRRMGRPVLTASSGGLVSTRSATASKLRAFDAAMLAARRRSIGARSSPHEPSRGPILERPDREWVDSPQRVPGRPG